LITNRENAISLQQGQLINNKGKNIIWDTLKNIEVDVKWAQKKEELVKETRENKILPAT